MRIFNCALTTLMVFLLHSSIQSNLYLILFYYLKFLIETWKIRQIVDITLDILYYTIVSATFYRTYRPPRKFVSLNNIYVFLELFLQMLSRPKSFWFISVHVYRYIYPLLKSNKSLFSVHLQLEISYSAINALNDISERKSL